MGSDDGADDERPSHRVQVDAFYASVHPITVDQYAEFTRETGHGAPGIRDLPLVVTPAHESSFRELAMPYVWRGGDPPRERAPSSGDAGHAWRRDCVLPLAERTHRPAGAAANRS